MNDFSPIIGLDGQPLRRPAPTPVTMEQARAETADTAEAEISAATVTGVRRVWQEAVAHALTPGKLAALLRAAADGDADSYLALAEEMEERDLHYASVLSTRKRALSGIEPRVEAASDEARDLEIAAAVRKLVSPLTWPDLVEDLLDGLGKGYAVVEIVWDTSRTPWVPARYEHRDPRWFRYDDATRRTLMLRDAAAPQGLPLPVRKFIVHEPKLKAGIALRGGLARLVAWSFMFKHFTVLDWVGFVETYGMPIRIGRYGPGANDKDLAVLKRAVMSLARDAAAVLPESMRVEFQQIAQSGSGFEVFHRLAAYLDSQVSKAVIGQTMTADSGSSRAQAEVHDQVRRDILRADARQLSATLNRDLVRPFVDLNFGPPANGYPLLLHPVLEPEDTKLLVDALAKLVPMGLEVEASVIRDKLGLPDPPPLDKRGPEVKLLVAPAPTAAPVPGADQIPADQDRAANRTAATCPGCGRPGCGGLDRDLHRALNRGAEADDLDLLREEALGDWRPMMEPILDPVFQALEQAGSYEEAEAALADLAQSMDPAALIRSLARTTWLARAAGDGADDPA